jgi:hypothetical protein
MGHDLNGEPGAIGGEPARRQVIEPDAVLEIADRVLDLGVAAMVGLQRERVAVAIGDEGMIVIRPTVVPRWPVTLRRPAALALGRYGGATRTAT